MTLVCISSLKEMGLQSQKKRAYKKKYLLSSYVSIVTGVGVREQGKRKMMLLNL